MRPRGPKQSAMLWWLGWAGLAAAVMYMLMASGDPAEDYYDWEDVFARVVTRAAMEADDGPALASLTDGKADMQERAMDALRRTDPLVVAALHATAEAAWLCKFGFLEMLAGHLQTTAGSANPTRLAAARRLYRSLVLSWLLAGEGAHYAAGGLLDMAALDLGYNWTEEAVKLLLWDYSTPGLRPGAPGLPECVPTWSVLRFMSARGGRAPPYPFHIEAGALSLAWRAGMARAYNSSMEFDAAKLGGQLESVWTRDGRLLLLWAWPAILRKPSTLDMVSHAFILESAEGSATWRLVALWDGECVVPGLVPDQPLGEGRLVRMEAELLVADGPQVMVYPSQPVSGTLEFPAGSWAVAALPYRICPPTAPPHMRGAAAASALRQTGEYVLSVSLAYQAPEGWLLRSHSVTLTPNKFYRLVSPAFMHRQGLPPATPGYPRSVLLASGRLHTALGYTQLENTFALGDSNFWGPEEEGPPGPLKRSWRGASAPPKCKDSPECKVLAAAYSKGRWKPVRPSLQGQLRDWRIREAFPAQEWAAKPPAGMLTAGAGAQLAGQQGEQSQQAAALTAWLEQDGAPALRHSAMRKWLRRLRDNLKAIVALCAMPLVGLLPWWAYLEVAYRWEARRAHLQSRRAQTADMGRSGKAATTAKKNGGSSSSSSKGKGPVKAVGKGKASQQQQQQQQQQAPVQQVPAQRHPRQSSQPPGPAPAAGEAALPRASSGGPLSRGSSSGSGDAPVGGTMRRGRQRAARQALQPAERPASAPDVVAGQPSEAAPASRPEAAAVLRAASGEAAPAAGTRPSTPPGRGPTAGAATGILLAGSDNASAAAAAVPAAGSRAASQQEQAPQQQRRAASATGGAPAQQQHRAPQHQERSPSPIAPSSRGRASEHSQLPSSSSGGSPAAQSMRGGGADDDDDLSLLPWLAVQQPDAPDAAPLALPRQPEQLQAAGVAAALGTAAAGPAAAHPVPWPPGPAGGAAGQAETEQEDAEGDLCVVCEEAPKQSALVPCGHHVLCMACTQSMFGPGGAHRHCPICRGEVAQFVQVYKL